MAVARNLATLFEEHAGFVARTLRRLGVPNADIEDALQEVFLVAQAKLDQIEPGKEKPFLFGVARRRAATRKRSLGRTTLRERQVSEALELAVPAPDSIEHTEPEHARAVLDEVLDAIPVDLRTVLVLHELEELEMTEIAQLVGVPLGTVASRLRRARQRFEIEADRVRAKLEEADR